MSLKSLGRSLGNVGKIGMALATGGPMAGIAATAAQLQRSPVRRGNGMGASITFNNPFRHGSGLIGRLGFGQNKGGRIDPDNGTCPRGYHLNKHKLSDGTDARTVCVRNRSMNVLNGRAAARAVARVKRAEKMVRKLKLFKPVHRLALGKPCGHRGSCSCK